MPRPPFTNPEDFLPNRETQSTVKILLRGESEYQFYSTNRTLVIDSNTYLAKLLKVSELKETFGQATNRVGVVLSNVGADFGELLASDERKLEFADVEVRRFYRKRGDSSTTEHKHYFSGKAVGAETNEQVLSFDVITPETAAGTCIAIETLSPTNGWRYPRTQTPPGAPGNDSGGVGGGSCPRVDQFVLAKDENENIQPILAESVTAKTMLWNPILKEFQTVKSVEIVENQPIWEVGNTLGAAGFASPTHPLIRTLGDERGAAIQALSRGRAALVWLEGGEVKRDRLTVVRDTQTFASVVRIEMEKGHIYAFGNNPDLMFVCHNAQNKGGTVN